MSVYWKLAHTLVLLVPFLVFLALYLDDVRCAHNQAYAVACGAVGCFCSSLVCAIVAVWAS